MDDFTWTIHLGAVVPTSFGIIMNECKDGSPWVGECLVDGVDVGFDAVVEAVAESFGMELPAAEGWLNDAIDRRLSWQRGHLLRQNPPELKVV